MRQMSETVRASCVGAIMWGAFLFSFTASAATPLIIPHVADGGVWQTTIVLTNTTASPASASLSFFQETSGNATQAWNLTFVENVNAQSLSIGAGATLFLHSTGTAAATAQGWGEMTADSGVVVYVIFTSRVPGQTAQQGTVSAGSSGTRILMPFDNTSGLVGAIGIANTGGTPIAISVNIRTSNGAVTQGTLPTIPTQGHAAFVISQQFPATTGLSGLAEFYVSSGAFSAIALSYNVSSGAFSSAPVYVQSGPPIITGSSSGGGGGSGNVVYAGLAIGKTTNGAGFPPLTPELTEFVGGQFGVYTAAGWALPYAGPTVGGCDVLSRTFTGVADPTTAVSLLDAGNISVSGPGLASGSKLTSFPSTRGPTYNLTPTQDTFALGGTYTLTGSGGTQVGPFNISATLPSSFTVTNWNNLTSINRANPLTVTWTGSGFDVLLITLTSVVTNGSSTTIVNITCPTSAGAGTFTVPTAALSSLLPTSNGTLSVTAAANTGGTLSAISSSSQSFTPSLVAGGNANYGQFIPYLAATRQVPIQ